MATTLTSSWNQMTGESPYEWMDGSIFPSTPSRFQCTHSACSSMIPSPFFKLLFLSIILSPIFFKCQKKNIWFLIADHFFVCYIFFFKLVKIPDVTSHSTIRVQGNCIYRIAVLRRRSERKVKTKTGSVPVQFLDLYSGQVVREERWTSKFE